MSSQRRSVQFVIDGERTPLITHVRTTKKTLAKARRLLYLSHGFAQFSESAWQFALVLFLAAFSNYRSLLLISTYGLVSEMSVCLLGASTGRFVDGADRLYVARFFIWIENLGVLIATSLCYWLLTIHPTVEDVSGDQQTFQGIPVDPLSVTLLLGIHFFGSLAKVLDKGFLVAIERDWVVVMSLIANLDLTIEEPNKIWLSETNVMMKQIDLSCRVAAPAVAGFVIGAFDTSTPTAHQHGSALTGAAILVGAVNVASLVAEYVCTAQIYHMLPALAETQFQHAKKVTASSEEAADLRATNAQRNVAGCGIFGVPSGLKMYLSQPVSVAGLGLSFLYLNAFTFGGLMTGYLVWRGMRLETVGIWRGISAAIGLAGTFAYHLSVRRLTLVTTGMWSIVYEFACLSVAFGSLFVSNYDVSVVMLIAGAGTSRVGLWVFDITVTQLMQEFIPSGIRGVVGGTQQSLNSLFQLLSFALGIIFPDPREFHIYASSGYIAVGLAMLLFMFGVFLNKSSFLTTIERDALS